MTMLSLPHPDRFRAADNVFPSIDASVQEVLTDDQIRFFLENGLLVVRNVLAPAELEAMREQTRPLIEQALAGGGDPDFFYRNHEETGERVPFRIEFVIDKTAAGKALLGHPFILRSVERLQGPNFIPTWDACVFKSPGAGVAIPWHRDAGTDRTREEIAPIFNVDFYLDEADATNCLWGIPGTHRLSGERADERIRELNADGEFRIPEDAVPIPMQPGDVIFHNILTIHGSPAARSGLRRVVYYEFRPAEIESDLGPHTPEYLPLKQGVLRRCLNIRRTMPYAADETPFNYRPTPPFDGPDPGEEETYRYPHSQYWRA
ncbi:MAG: phytanoyl-CoA dioxygenase family protein [Capsulimonadales bacterium]|nr:phytanoyl-CoA dioxygenase family protein [Capsulimonadales bacterium]